MGVPQVFSCLFIRCGNYRWFVFILHNLVTFTNLPPFAPQTLLCISARMEARTSAMHHCCGILITADLLHLHKRTFPDLLSSTTPIPIICASVTRHSDCLRLASCASQLWRTSPIPSGLVEYGSRNMFTLLRSIWFSSVASHPTSR